MVLDAHHLISIDTSGLDALSQLRTTLVGRGVRVMLVDVNEQPLSLIQRAGFAALLGPNNLCPTVASALDSLRVDG